MRYIKRELIQPAYQVPVPMSQWTDTERQQGKSSRKQAIDPIDTAETLFVIAVSAVSDAALTPDEIRASIGLQDALDPKHKGEASCPMDEWIKLEDNEFNYLIKKLDSRSWFNLQLRETLEMLQSWREAPTHIPGEAGSIAQIGKKR